MKTILVVVQVFVVLLLALCVLLQRSGDDGVANLTGSSGMTSKNVNTFLTKVTILLGGVFMINSLVLAKIASHEARHTKSIVEDIVAKQVDNDGVPLLEGDPSRNQDASLLGRERDKADGEAQSSSSPVPVLE